MAVSAPDGISNGALNSQVTELVSEQNSIPSRNIHETQDFKEEIQKYPLLYDKFSVDFKNKHEKLNAWEAVAKTFGVTVEDA